MFSGTDGRRPGASDEAAAVGAFGTGHFGADLRWNSAAFDGDCELLEQRVCAEGSRCAGAEREETLAV